MNSPPHTLTFDPANRGSLLRPHNRAQSSASSSSAEMSALSALSAVSTIFSSVLPFMHPDRTLPLPSTPGPIIHNRLASHSANTPPAIFNTPSKLERFLQAAERSGIPGVVSFHSVLSEKGYGPDIMHLVGVEELAKIGMLPGDALRLKDYASKWWNNKHRRVAKRPRDAETVSVSTRALPPLAKTTPPSKCLRFEKRFNDGGGMTIYGPAVKSGSCEDEDYTWWLYSDELKMYLQLPTNKVPILKDF